MIERLTFDDKTDKQAWVDWLKSNSENFIGTRFKRVPNSDLFFRTQSDNDTALAIALYTPKKKLIGIMECCQSSDTSIPFTQLFGSNPYYISGVSIYEEYWGQQYGLALYGIAIAVLKMTLTAGCSQTPHGRRMWAEIFDIPGVEVGIVAGISDHLFPGSSDKTSSFATHVGRLQQTFASVGDTILRNAIDYANTTPDSSFYHVHEWECKSHFVKLPAYKLQGRRELSSGMAKLPLYKPERSEALSALKIANLTLYAHLAR